MSLQIDNLDELKSLIKDTNIKISSVDELKDLLTGINASYNPDASRVRVVKMMAMVTPLIAFSVAGICSFFLLGNKSSSNSLTPNETSVIAVMWGTSAIASIVVNLWAWLAIRDIRHRDPFAGSSSGGKPPAAGELPVASKWGDLKTNITTPEQRT
jgi:hypothetical protein